MSDSLPFISGIILAAGHSERMGRVKQLLPFKGKALLAHIVDTAFDSLLNEIIVILGHKADQIKKSIHFHGARVILNHDYGAGLSTSLITGISHMSGQGTAALFLLGDQPLVTKRVINQIIEEYVSSRSPLVIPTFCGKRGNPVLVGRPLFSSLKSVKGDQGARVLFDAYPDRVREIDVGDPSILMDIDTQEDYNRLLSESG